MMVTLDEIEQAAAGLPPAEKAELMLFLAARMRADGARPPEPRRFSRDQVNQWVSEDESELARFKKPG
jgi:hypothetical protein